MTDGGDDACWLDRVCDRCGTLVEDDGDHVCREPVGAGEPPVDEQPAG